MTTTPKATSATNAPNTSERIFQLTIKCASTTDQARQLANSNMLEIGEWPVITVRAINAPVWATKPITISHNPTRATRRRGKASPST